MFDIQARAAMGSLLPADAIQMEITNDTLARTIDDLVADVANVAGIWHNAVAHLYQNPLVPTPTTTIAELTECNFTGYVASGNLTFSTGLDDQGVHVAVADASAPFHCTGDPAGQKVYGVYLTDHNATPRLLAAGNIAVGGLALTNGLLIPFTATLAVGNS